MDINIKPLDTAVEVIKEFLQKIIFPPLEEVGLLMSDRVKLWRFKNQVKILTDAENYLKEKNIKTKKVSLKVLAPLLEESSLEEDESLQEKWSALIVNTVKENSDIDTTVFSYILSQLTPKEADIFSIIYQNCITIQDVTPIDSTSIIKATITDRNKGMYVGELRKSNKNMDLYFDNLIRLRLIKELMKSDIETRFVCVTELGMRFMLACTFQ